MRLTPMMTREQVRRIHAAALRVLEEVGIKVENEEIRRRLTAVGGRLGQGDIVRFEPRDVEHWIAASPKGVPEASPPRIRGSVGIYECRYLDPASGMHVPFTEDLFARCAGLARSLPNVHRVHTLGIAFRPDDIPLACYPLAEKLFAWKYGIDQDGSVIDTRLCQPLLEMFQVHADQIHRPLKEVFKAVGYMISPLRLARLECEQLLFFRDRGLAMWIGHMPSQGGTAPVSLAGSLVLALTEQLFLYLLNCALWGPATLWLGASVPVMDMQSLSVCYGRPEEARINAAFASIADFYGCPVGGHTGGTDAKVPSCQAGVQKAVGAIWTAPATGSGQISVGLLSMDEVCSPVQMVLDDEIVAALNRLLAEANVDDCQEAFEQIRAAGHGGSHIGTDYTAEHFRDCLFLPRTWSSGLLSNWDRLGRQTDVHRARAIVEQFDRTFVAAHHISSDEERQLRQIIRRAAAGLSR